MSFVKSTDCLDMERETEREAGRYWKIFRMTRQADLVMENLPDDTPAGYGIIKTCSRAAGQTSP